MAEQLTSVRFDTDTLDTLRLLADIHDTNVAEEVRKAVRRYVHEVTSDEDFRAKAEEAMKRKQDRVEKLLSAGKRRVKE